jgi:putative thiamine transport system permease protein
MAGGVRPARLAPPLTLAILLGPLAFGLAGTALPALGYLPELGGEHFTTAHFSALGEVPGIMRSAALSILIGLVTTLVSLGAVAAFVASDLGTPGFPACGG